MCGSASPTPSTQARERPAPAETRRYIAVHFRITQEEWAQLESIAKQEEDTISAMVRDALYKVYGIGAL